MAKNTKDSGLDLPWMIKKVPPSDREDSQWNANILTVMAVPISSVFQLVPLKLARRLVEDHNKLLLKKKLTLFQWEKIEILKRMEELEGDTEKVAHSMGVSRRTIQYKLAEYKA
jgi:transcriptional regulator with PAS, ATPase and Fis domain